MLRELWAEVLNDEPDSFKNEDIFFEVGGDSIRAQQLIAAAKKQGIALTMEHIFLNASLEDMSDTIEFITNDENGDTEQTSVLEPFSLLETKEQSLDQIRHVIATKLNVSELAIENAYPCSPMQESLLSESEGTSNLYVRQFVFHINLEANLDQLRQAWNDAITANPVLRTRICYLNASTGFIQAVINEDFEWMVERTSLSSFLKVDARQEMFTGEKFFRYTVVKDQDEDGQEQRHLVWTVHHALCDGASIPEVLDEVARRMKSAVLRPRYSFDGFIKSAVLDIDTQQEEQFWKRMFKSHNPTPFPVVPQAPDFQARPGKAHKCLLTIGQNASRGLTNALLLRAAWAILLSHYTGTENIVFGTIRNGRSSSIPGLATMTGPTISLAPISLHVDSQKTIASFLSGIRVQSAEMMRFEHTGVSKMRKYLANGPSTVMDFQTMLVVHPRRFEDVIAPATQTLGIDYDDSMGKKEEHPYPLVLTCTIDTETEVTLSVQYDERVLHTSQIENLSHHFQALLTQLTYASPDALLGSLSPLSQRDIIQIKEWNKFTPPTEQVCIHELFQRQVERQPEAVAVCSHNQSFTYADVESFSSALAIQLIEVGVIPGQFVAVCFEKSIWTVVSILAVFKAGAVYVPIEPDHPPSRINEVITTTSIKVALASPYGATILKQFCETLITVNSEPTTVEGTLPTVLPSTIAYLLFTSGSTGKPKGILMSHSGICTSIINHGSAFGAGPDWRTLQFGAHTFDLSIGEFFTTLAFGGCICIPSQDGRLNYLADEITNLQANTLMVVPTVANLLFPEDVPTLKTIVLAGEPITKETIVRWANHVNLTAAYGPSETAVYCSGNANVSPDAHPSNIGPAIGGTMWIAHPENHHRLTAIGGVGEIVISGGLLGSGYFNDKSTTDAAFVPAPQWMREMHPGSPFDRIYKSGDLARYNADGTFHIVGRKDTQVKLRGFRIELGEIENQIMASGFVAAALSTLSSKGPCAKQIVAVLSFNRSALADKPASLVTLSKDRHTTQTQSMVDRLRNKLSLLLPEYMVPTIWVVVESMPLLISGKVDRKTIKTWVDSMEYPIFRDIVEGLQRKQGDSGIFPGSLAHTLCQLWSEVLNVPMNQLGMGTSFFAVGGDSIAAIQIVSRAKKLGIPITVRSIISAKTLGNLTTMVEQTHAERGLMPGKSIVDVKRKSITESLQPYQDLLKRKLRQEPSATVIDAYEFAPFQREIWKQRNANAAVFLLSWQMEISSRTVQSISVSRLAQAWERVVQKFPILRSIFFDRHRGKSAAHSSRASQCKARNCHVLFSIWPN